MRHKNHNDVIKDKNSNFENLINSLLVPLLKTRPGQLGNCFEMSYLFGSEHDQHLTIGLITITTRNDGAKTEIEFFVLFSWLVVST